MWPWIRGRYCHGLWPSWFVAVNDCRMAIIDCGIHHQTPKNVQVKYQLLQMWHFSNHYQNTLHYFK